MQPLSCALIQTATHWHDPEANRRMFGELIAEVDPSTDIVVLPEMFSTGFTMSSAEVAEPMSGPTVAWMRALAAERGMVICGSVVIEERGEYFNRFVWAQSDGDLKTYDKRHCFRMADEHLHYAAGQDRLIIEFKGWRICPMVCYDLRFPVWFRNRSDYDVLLCVANWPAARVEAWNTLLRARAIENQCYTVAVNIVGVDGNAVAYSGGSAAYGPDGTVINEAFDSPQTFGVQLEYAPLEKLREAFPVWADADGFCLDDLN